MAINVYWFLPFFGADVFLGWDTEAKTPVTFSRRFSSSSFFATVASRRVFDRFAAIKQMKARTVDARVTAINSFYVYAAVVANTCNREWISLLLN